MPRAKGSKNKPTIDAKPKVKKAEPKKISRGRTGADITQNSAEHLQVKAGERDPKVSVRPDRVPMQGALKLSIGSYKMDKENYAYHWFADSTQRPGRMTQALAAYWEYCTDEQGNNIEKPSGPETLFFMRLDMKYALEDKALKRKKIRDRMAEESRIGADEYAPDGGKSATYRS